MKHTFPDGAIFSALLPIPTWFARVVDGELVESLAYRTPKTTHEGFYGNLLTSDGAITRCVMLFETPVPYQFSPNTDYENESSALIPQRCG